MNTEQALHRPDVERIGFSVDEAVFASGVKRSTLYKLIRTGQLRTVTIARRRIIPASALRALVEGTPDAAA